MYTECVCVLVHVCECKMTEKKRKKEFWKSATICYNKRFKTTFSCNEFLNIKYLYEIEATLSV